MSAHLTEEEQLEALKRWWADNGKSLIVAVVLGVGGFLGFNSWQDSRQASDEAASAQYEQIAELIAKGEALTDQESATVTHLASQLKENHSDTLYGIQAALLLAKQAVSEQELAQAEAELRWAKAQAGEANIAHLVRLRLARVLSAQEKYTDALAELKVADEGAFASLYAEGRGDAYLAQADAANAANEYQAALNSLSAEDAARANTLRMKLNSVQMAADKKDA